MVKRIIFIVLSWMFVCLTGCNNNTNNDIHSFIFQGTTQGTYYQITYYAKDSIVTHSEIKQLLDDFLKIASLWDSTSEISRVNRNEKIKLSNTFKIIFDQAQEVSRMTNAAFDITVGGLVNVWGFGAQSPSVSSQINLDSLKRFIGYQNVDIIDDEIVKKFPETNIDFNGIAKGYSVDMISEYLRLHQVERFIVDIGGEVYASNLKPDGSKWNIGIEKPSDNKFSEQQIQYVISLSDKAVATSGSYRNYIVKDTVRFSHTIDPQTGKPISNVMLSATVVANKCAIADALATAFMVMGIEKALDFLKNNPQFDGYFIYYDEQGNINVAHSDGFKNHFL